MRRPLEGLVWGLAIGLAGVLATWLPGIAELQQDAELRWLFRLRGPLPPPPEVVIVAIDEQTARSLGVPSRPAQWPRNLHARLIDRLAHGGARVICFDLTFDTPSSAAENDTELAGAIRRAGNVVLTDFLRSDSAEPATKAARTSDDIRIERVDPPIPIFVQAALAHAPFPLPRQARVDAYWTFKTGAGDRPTLPVVAFQIYAFEAYKPFVQMLGLASPGTELPTPATASDLFSAHGAADENNALRSVFLSDPAVGRRMAKQLAAAAEDEQSPSTKRLIGSLLSLYRGGETAYLNFRGPARTIATVPYEDVLRVSDVEFKQRFPFDGKAVFVGFSASSQPGQDRIRDDYETVFSDASGLNLSGVEIAATAFADLLNDRAVHPVPPPWRFAILLLWGAALSTGCRLLRPAAAGALVIVLAPTYLALAVHEFAHAALWLPLAVPLGFQAPLALFRGVLLNYRDARRERKRIREAVSQYLPVHVVDKLVEQINPITSADRLVHGACLATDVERYTALAEKMDPADLTRLMNRYYAELFGPVERLGGFVSNLAGDAMLAIWVASASGAAAGRQACLAAVDIGEALERFNLAATDRPALHTRLGLHSGPMVLGSIGAAGHYQYEAMGDMVNTATRIQGLGKHVGARILASESTAAALEGILTRPLGSFLLAGKSTAVPIVELLGRAQDVTVLMAPLCRSFEEALDDYRSRRWREAADRFAEILRLFPQDGPSRFYLQRCEGYLLGSAVEPWFPIVRVDQK
ncbi:MAG: adenylate/guanylate cyclase domain-containing protein [Burkholderiaceae bacterium]|nr:adenylate/guanylate cyclase domain-containing protein [Burkholderiaceae bacterium]